MEKVVTISHSFEEAEQADKEYYRSLTGIQRLEIMLELNRRWAENNHVDTSKGLERVYRIVTLEGSTLSVSKDYDDQAGAKFA